MNFIKILYIIELRKLKYWTRQEIYENDIWNIEEQIEEQIEKWANEQTWWDNHLRIKLRHIWDNIRWKK